MSDKMREGFEAWAKTQGLYVYYIGCDDMYSEEVDENGFFTNQTTQRAWHAWTAAWQASRAAVVVELPDSWDSNTGIGSYSSDVRSALDAAGVKYK